MKRLTPGWLGAPRLDLRLLLLTLVALHGAFAAGMVPLLNEQLGADASLAFALYFGALMGWLNGLASLDVALEQLLRPSLELQIRGFRR